MDFSTIAIFVQTADHRSLSEAAARLGMTTSGVSRALSRLEKQVGALLLDRTTRRVELTPDGAEFYQRCRQLLVDMEQAVTLVGAKRTRPVGQLRVQCPVGFGKHVIIPALPKLIERYPELVINLQLEDRIHDLVSENIDVAVRVGRVSDSKLIARKLCRTRFVACASPGYIKQHGAPRTPADLSKHRCIGYFNSQTSRYREWGYVEDSVERWRSMHGAININTADGLLDAVLNGCGIATLTTFVIASAVARKELSVLLGDYTTRGPTISVVYPPSKKRSVAVRAMVDFLAEIVPKNPPWEQIIDAAVTERRRGA